MAKKQNIRYGQAAVEADVCAGLDEADEDVKVEDGADGPHRDLAVDDNTT
jgi:hypothetical protein